MPICQPILPMRINQTDACRLLNIDDPSELEKLAAEELLTRLQPNGKKRGSRVYYLTDELRLWGETGDRAKLKAFRKSKGRK